MAFGENLRHIERAGAARAGAFHDVEVDHGGGDVGVAEEVLDGAYVDAAFEEVGCERMAQGVAGGGFREACLAGCVFELALHGGFMDVVTGDSAGSRVRAKGCGREEELPRPLAGGAGVFSQEGFGHVDVAASACEVIGVFLAFFGEVFFQAGFEGSRERNDPVFRAFSVVDDDGAMAEVDVFDAQPEGFHKAEAGAIHELGSEFPRGFEVGENGLHLVTSQDDWGSALGVAGNRLFESEIGLAEDFSCEEDHCIESLFLGGGRDIAFEREVAEVTGDPLRPGILGRLFEADEAEAGEAGVPMDIGLFGGITESAETNGAADFLANAGDFLGCVRQGSGRNGHLSRWDVDGFSADGSMVGFEWFGLVGEPSPIEGFRPWDVEDVSGQPCDGADSLLELPSGEIGATSESMEEFQCGCEVVVGHRMEP